MYSKKKLTPTYKNDILKNLRNLDREIETKNAKNEFLKETLAVSKTLYFYQSFTKKI